MESDLILRLATLADASSLFEWRNDPNTRAASKNIMSVGFEEHLGWLAKTLENSDRQLFVAMIGETPVGTVRADRNDRMWEISWTVAPSRRGEGIGKKMVSSLTMAIKEPVRAEIKAGNIASVKIAEFAGMSLDKEEDGIMYYSRSD